MVTKRGRTSLRAAAAIACAASGIGNLAWGQEGSGGAASSPPAQPSNLAQAPDGQAPPGASAATQIDEVVVTATKRRESARDIPESIAVFSGTQLESSGKTNLTDFIEETPGVTASEGGPGFTRVTMRGIDTDTSPYSGITSTVGYFIGDTAFTDSYNNSIIPDLSAFDLQSVEILKGPQATLFGGAALAGAVRYILNEPVLGEWEARGFTQFVDANGGGDAETSGALVNIPVYKDQLSARVDYVRRNYPGTMTDTYTGARDQAYGGGNQVRATVLWQPLRDLRFKFTHLTQDFHSANDLFAARFPDGPRENVTNIIPSPSTNSFRLDNVEANYNFSDMRLTVLGSSLQKKVSLYGDDTSLLIGTPPPGYPASATIQSATTDNMKALSEEVRLQSNGDGPLKWLAGLYFYNSSSYFNLNDETPTGQSLTAPGSFIGINPELLALFEFSGVPASALEQNSLLDGTSNSKSYEHAAFFNVDYTLWQRLDLAAGMRIYEASVGGGYIGSGPIVLLENNLQDSNTESTIKEKGVAPKFSATYHFTPDISLYATAAKGYRYGGINDFPSTPANGVPATYKSDSLWNYELGLRTAWLHNTLHADLTPYYIDYKNPIIAQNTQAAIPIGYSANVGAAKSYGVESSVLWKTPLRGLSLLLNGAVSNAHTTQAFKDSSGVELEPGQEMPGASHLQYTAAAYYQRPLGWDVRGGPDVGYTFVGKAWNDLNHDAQIDGYGNLRAGFFFERAVYDVKARLAINATNLLNTTRPTAAAINTAIITQTPVDGYTLTPPREISVRLSLDY